MSFFGSLEPSQPCPAELEHLTLKLDEQTRGSAPPGDGAFTFVAMAGAYKEAALIIDASWNPRDIVAALLRRRGMFIGN